MLVSTASLASRRLGPTMPMSPRLPAARRSLRTAFLCAVLTLAASQSASAAQPLFGPPIDTASGAATSMDTGDVNGDGHTDLGLTIPSGTGPTAAVLLGDGDGRFRAAEAPPLTATEGPILIRDVNGDGAADLLVAESFGQFLHVLLGAGDGTFAPDPSPAYFGASQALATAAADFNKDGNLDVAIGTRTPSGVTVMLGDGHGGFTQAPGGATTTPGMPGSIAIGDVNEDGIPDVATTNYMSSVSVLLGAGDGTLHDATGSPAETSSYPEAASISDLDADGHKDVVFLTDSDIVRQMKGSGTSEVGAPQTVAFLPHRSQGFLVGDLDHAHGPDFVVNEGGVLRVLLNDEASAFLEAPGSPFITPALGLVDIADVDGDGDPDLVGVSSTGVSVLLNNGRDEPAPGPGPTDDGGATGGTPSPAPRVKVPSLKGLRLAAARRRLTHHHLRLGALRRPKHVNRRHVLVVAGQTPRGGALVARRTTVRLRLKSVTR